MHNGNATNIGTITANTWIKLKVEIDTYAQTFNVWINDSVVASKVNFAQSVSSMQNVGKLEYTCVKGTTLYIDDIKIYKIANEPIDANFGIPAPFYGRTGNDVDVFRAITNNYAQEKPVSLLIAEFTPLDILVNISVVTKNIAAGATETFATKIINGTSSIDNFVKIFVLQDVNDLRPLCKMEYEKIVKLLGSYFDYN